MEKKIVPTLINFRESEIGAVPFPINRSEAEIGAALTTIQEKKTKVRAVLVNHFGNKRKTRIALILVGLLFLGTCPLFAAETVKKENVFKQIASIETRGAVNFFTTPAEFVYTLKTEIKNHPKAWPATYIPRSFANIVIRVGSSVNDFIVLPWYVAWSDATPLPRRFALPAYVWKKE